MRGAMCLDVRVCVRGNTSYKTQTPELRTPILQRANSSTSSNVAVLRCRDFGRVMADW